MHSRVDEGILQFPGICLPALPSSTGNIHYCLFASVWSLLLCASNMEGAGLFFSVSMNISLSVLESVTGVDCFSFLILESK